MSFTCFLFFYFFIVILNFLETNLAAASGYSKYSRKNNMGASQSYCTCVCVCVWVVVDDEIVPSMLYKHNKFYIIM